MALNCNTCTNKFNAAIEGHCSEFNLMPQLDACGSYNPIQDTPAPHKPGTPTGVYIGLTREDQLPKQPCK